jgi:V/A-type H+-transporting ATPase subunit I
VLKKLKRQGSLVNCLIISLGPADLPYKELELPRSSLSASLQRIAKDKKVLAALNAGLERYAVYYQELLLAKRKLQKELEFHQALEGMGEDAGLTYIKGFVPIDAQEALADCARKEKWAILVSDPADEYNVPVLLRNPRWVALINPLFKFLEILPGYSELDISLPFLIFFSLFFGILIGDAGYGTIYALATFIFQRKLAKRKVKPDTFYLFYILSFCSIAFGLLSGTFFGQEWLGRIGFKPLLPALNNPHHIQAVCFFIGAIHLTIAHSWRFILKMPSWAALADLGWMAVLWTSFFLAKTLVLGDSFPLFGKWLLACGISLVIFFTNPNKNILKGVGEGLGTLALSLMNNFTDVVSYIRLFAVGLAGIAIADAFNAMAALVGFQNVLAIIVSVLILLIGHTLGIVLGPVSVLVHGVRLNVLEFSGHANVTWSGESYRPFKEGT